MAKKIDKLKKYLEHWADHNDSHRESYEEWRDFAKQEGLEKLSGLLENAIEMINKSSEYLRQAKDELEH